MTRGFVIHMYNADSSRVWLSVGSRLTTLSVSKAYTLIRPWKYPKMMDVGRSRKSTGYLM